MSIIKPITPDEIGTKQAIQIPSFVIEAFNIEIAKNYNTVLRSATVMQNAVLSQIVKQQIADYEEATVDAIQNLRNQAFSNKWLNVEAMYEDAGWKVSYEKPGFNEPGEAFFTFKKK